MLGRHWLVQRLAILIDSNLLHCVMGRNDMRWRHGVWRCAVRHAAMVHHVRRRRHMLRQVLRDRHLMMASRSLVVVMRRHPHLRRLVHAGSCEGLLWLREYGHSHTA